MQSGPGYGPAAGEEKDAGVRSLIDVNGLAYRMTPGMSVATSRITREWDALRGSYGPGEIMSFAISSGAAYVDPDNSYLKFTINLQVPDDGQSAYYRLFWGDDENGRQTALNLFQDMRLTHSSGYEIDRVNRGFAPYKYAQLAYTKDKQWWDTYGSLMRGFQVGTGTLSGVVVTPATAAHPFFFGADGGRGATQESYVPTQVGGVIGASGTIAPIVQAGRVANTADFSRNAVLDNFTPHVAAGLTPFTSSQYTQQITGFSREQNKPFGFLPTKGTNGTETYPDNPTPGAAGKISIDVVLPLSVISGIWDTDMLAPSFLMAGARLDMTLSSLAQAFVFRNAIPRLRNALGNFPATDPRKLDISSWKMTIDNPKMVLETVTFTDAVLRSISMTSASSGLELPFVAMHYSQVPMPGSTVSLQVNRGLSRANMVIVRAYPGITQTNDNSCAQIDSVRAYPIQPALGSNAGGFQVKLGSEFMPNKPIDNFVQLYHAVQNAFGNWKSDKRNTVTMRDFAGTGEFAGPNGAFQGLFPFAGSLGIFAMTLEKSSTLAQSGSPISASRDLNVVIGPCDTSKWNDGGAGGNGLEIIGNTTTGVESVNWKGLYLDVYVPYVTLCTVFLDSILIRS
jgi:hypothetical protein